MNTKQTALDAYLARTAAIRANWDGCNNSPTTTLVTTLMPSIGATSAISGGWRPDWTSCSRSSAAPVSDDINQLPEMTMTLKLTNLGK